MTILSVHLPQAMLSACREEAQRHYPLESGGTFMGYIQEDYAVVEALIPPGPKAQRTRYGFSPDHEWQLGEIARCYEQSGRRTTYLGDWHSHPNAGSGELSAKDRAVLRRIIRTEDARCSNPLMAVLWGSPTSLWSLSVWSACLARRRITSRALSVHSVRFIAVN